MDTRAHPDQIDAPPPWHQSPSLPAEHPTDLDGLREVVSELRWHLRHSADLRQAVLRVVRRQEQRLERSVERPPAPGTTGRGPSNQMSRRHV